MLSCPLPHTPLPLLTILHLSVQPTIKTSVLLQERKKNTNFHPRCHRLTKDKIKPRRSRRKKRTIKNSTCLDVSIKLIPPINVSANKHTKKKNIQVVGDCASQSGVKQIRLIVVAFICRKKGSAKRTREARLFLEAYFFLARLQSFKLREITHTHVKRFLDETCRKDI